MTTLCCAYLRIYEPLASFVPAEREWIDRALRDRSGLERSRSGLGLIAPSECHEIYERVVDGVSYVCPARTRLRTWLGLVSFERSIPEGAATAFFSYEEIEEARRELTVLEARRPGLRPSMLQSTWYVPLWWFIPFEEGERRIEQDGDHPTIRYETSVRQACQRVDRALELLRDAVVHPVIVGMIHELSAMLAAFDEGGLVELDYASVSQLFEGDELADDDTAADVWKALEAVAAGDGLRAGLHYRRASRRWARSRGRESGN